MTSLGHTRRQSQSSGSQLSTMAHHQHRCQLKQLPGIDSLFKAKDLFLYLFSCIFKNFLLNYWFPRLKSALGYSTISNRRENVNFTTLGFQFSLIYKSSVARTFPLLILKIGLTLSLKINVFFLK